MNFSIVKYLEKKELQDKAYRAEILLNSIELEKSIEDFILSYFFHENVNLQKNPENKFHYYLFEDSKMLSFDNKREMLRRILNVEKYLDSQETKLLNKNISEIIELRNIIAHRRRKENLDLMMRFDGEAFSYSTYKIEENKLIIVEKIFTKEQFQKKIGLIEDLIKKIDELTKRILKKN